MRSAKPNMDRNGGQKKNNNFGHQKKNLSQGNILQKLYYLYLFISFYSLLLLLLLSARNGLQSAEKNWVSHCCYCFCACTPMCLAEYYVEFIKWYQNLKSLPLKNIGGWHLCALKQVRVCDAPNQMSMWNPQPGRSVWCLQPDHTLWCPQPGENLWCPRWGESVMPWSRWESDSFEQLSLWCLQPGESLWCPQSG